MTYEYCKKVIEGKLYETKEKMIEMLDVFLLRGRITLTEYEELSGMLT